MKTQLAKQFRICPLPEPDPTGPLDNIALFNEDRTPFEGGGSPTVFPVDPSTFGSGVSQQPDSAEIAVEITGKTAKLKGSLWVDNVIGVETLNGNDVLFYLDDPMFFPAPQEYHQPGGLYGPWRMQMGQDQTSGGLILTSVYMYIGVSEEAPAISFFLQFSPDVVEAMTGVFMVALDGMDWTIV